MKTGRNDPCTCGSGKKFKKCCLRLVETYEFEYLRQRRVESGLIPRLLDYALETLGPEAFHDAWKEFNDFDDIDELEADSPMNIVFVPWFIFNWQFQQIEPGPLLKTIAESFWIEYESDLTDDEITFLDSAIGLPYSLCEVLEVKPGVGMKLRDLFTREDYELVERKASEVLNKGEIIYCASLHIGNIRSNLATAPFALRPTAKRDVLELREVMVEVLQRDKLTEKDVEQFESDIRALFLNLMDQMFTPPNLVNTDNEPFVPQKVYFDLKSVEDSYHQLKSLAGEENEERLLEHATIADGHIVAAKIPWAGGNAEAQKGFGNPVLLGVIRLSDGQLIAEVNSVARAESIRRIVEERLGDQVSYKTTLIEPIDLPMTQMWEEAASEALSGKRSRHISNLSLSGGDIVGGVSDPSPNSALLDMNSVEGSELMDEIAKQHWDTWFDIPVPALNNMTPREAANSEDGRDLLGSLLLEYEINSAESPDNLVSPDIPALRRELGLE